MFSTFFRLGAALSAAALLASCSSGSGQAETQQSTPEGLFEGTMNVTFNNSTSGQTGAVVPPGCTQNVIVFVNYAGVYYMFNTLPTAANPANLLSASSGSLSFSGGTAGSSNVLEVVPPNAVNQTSGTNYYTLPWSQYHVQAPNGTNCNIPITYAGENLNVEYPSGTSPVTYSAATPVPQVGNSTVAPTFTGAYNTGINFAGTFTYSLPVDSLGINSNTKTAVPSDYKTSSFNINYNTDYQNVQNLGTLAGTYVGTVATSQFSEAATFTFGPASVPANSGNAYGVALVTGTGASGCTYNGTVSPLFKGNGYTMLINSGPPPCVLPNNQFAGMVYLNVAQKQLFSFSPNAARTDGLIFSGVPAPVH
jgi:hypothetical protein